MSNTSGPPRHLSDWLPGLIGPLNLQANGGDYATPRETWNLVGGVTLTDDPENDRINIEVTGGGSADAAPIDNIGTGPVNNAATTLSGTPSRAIRFTGVAPELTGLAGGSLRTTALILLAVGGPLIIDNMSGSSTGPNQIETGTGGSLTIAQHGGAIVFYDPTSTHWVVVATVGGSTSLSGTTTGVLSLSAPDTGVADASFTIPEAGHLAIGYDIDGPPFGKGSFYVYSASAGSESYGTAAFPDGGVFRFSDEIADNGGFNSFTGASFQSSTAGDVGISMWGASGGVPWFGDPNMLAPTQIFAGGQGLASLQDGLNIVFGLTGKLSLDGSLYSSLSGPGKYLGIDAGNVTVCGGSFAIPALNIDWKNPASIFTKTLAAGPNAITFSNTFDGTIIVILTGAASTVTWPAGIKWPGGTPPTQTPSGEDVYTFVQAGGTIRGTVVQGMA